MGSFLENEKGHQINFKLTGPHFSTSAKKVGFYRGKPRSFCLPSVNAEENLFIGIRQPAMDYFRKHAINWHDGREQKPSNHLCDSQVCCANFLFPFSNQPDALSDLLRPIYPRLEQVQLIEDDLFVAFEWIGQHNYLREGKRPDVDKRTRGANFTSTDAAVKFTRNDGLTQVVLIEWKYTESYPATSLKLAPSGVDRSNIYECLYLADDCILRKELIPGFASLFYEPFYQLMRQQFLAHEMERNRELDADIVSLLHISPAHNQDFNRVTSPKLASLGGSPTEIWQKLVKFTDRFSSVSTEALFSHFRVSEYPGMVSWWNYIKARYAWIDEHELLNQAADLAFISSN